jgi:hypothetical protein
MVSHGMGDQNLHLELLRASEGTLSRWSRLHLQSLTPTNPHWARVVGYGPFSLWVIHKEGLCPSSGDINRLMMMSMKYSRKLLINGINIFSNAPQFVRQAPKPQIQKR